MQVRPFFPVSWSIGRQIKSEICTKARLFGVVYGAAVDGLTVEKDQIARVEGSRAPLEALYILPLLGRKGRRELYVGT